MVQQRKMIINSYTLGRKHLDISALNARGGDDKMKLWKIKESLWKLGLWINRCPRCNGKLKDHGYSGYNQYYTCDKCGWGK